MSSLGALFSVGSRIANNGIAVFLMLLKAVGFSASQRSRHFQAHGNDFDAMSAYAYEAMAVSFMNQLQSPQICDCSRPQGDRIRYDSDTRAFGVIDSAGIVRYILQTGSVRVTSNRE